MSWAGRISGVLLVAAVGLAARGADGPPALSGAVAVAPDPTAAAPYLGPIFRDEAAGFRIAPPAGARTINRPGGADLLTFAVDAKGWGGNLRLTPLDKKQTVEGFAKDAGASIAKDYKGVQVATQNTELGGRKAVRLSISMEAEAGSALAGGRRGGAATTVTLYVQEIIIQTRADQVMILSLFSPLKDREPATRTFDAMLGSLELFKPEDLGKRRLAAALAGKAWLARRTAEELRSKLIKQPQWFRMLVGGHDVGWVRFDEGDKEPDKNGQLVDVERGGNKGVLLVLTSQSYPSDGTVVSATSAMFWAYARDANGQPRPHFSNWINTAVTQTASRPGLAGATAPRWLRETGFLQQEGTGFTDAQIAELQRQREAQIRANPTAPPPPEIDVSEQLYRLRVTLDGDPTQLDTIRKMGGNGITSKPGANGNVSAMSGFNDGIDVTIPKEAAPPLPKILEYTWPRLVDLSKPSEMSFTVFNSMTEKPALRTLIVAGRDRITLDGRPVDCFKCVDELDPGSTTLWVDATGRTLLMRTSDQTILAPTTEAEMRKQWGDRLTQAGN